MRRMCVDLESDKFLFAVVRLHFFCATGLARKNDFSQSDFCGCLPIDDVFQRQIPVFPSGLSSEVSFRLLHVILCRLHRFQLFPAMKRQFLHWTLPATYGSAEAIFVSSLILAFLIIFGEFFHVVGINIINFSLLVCSFQFGLFKCPSLQRFLLNCLGR